MDIPKTTGKSGGEREPFYKTLLASTQLALTTEMYCKRIAERLCKSKFFATVPKMWRDFGRKKA